MNLAADDSNFFALVNGSPVPAGDAVYMGNFGANSDATIAALAAGNQLTPASYATLVADFVPLNGTALQLMGTGTGNPAATSGGAIAAAFTGTNPSFASTAIYVMVVNTNTTTGASQVGVFKGDSTWTYPLNMATTSISIDTDNALTAPLIGTFATVAGTQVPFNESSNGAGNSTVGLLKLDPIVPEPSTYLLVGTGLLGLLGLRRRS